MCLRRYIIWVFRSVFDGRFPFLTESVEVICSHLNIISEGNYEKKKHYQYEGGI